GVLGFKCFLTPSGVDEFPNVSEGDLQESAPELARLGATLLVHAEWPALLRPVAGDPRLYRNFLDSRPRGSEYEAIARMIALSRARASRGALRPQGRHRARLRRRYRDLESGRRARHAAPSAQAHSVSGGAVPWRCRGHIPAR